MKLRIALLSLIAIVCMTLAWPLLPGHHRANPFAALPPLGGEVHGTIILAPIPHNTSGNHFVVLPDITVYLQDVHSLQTTSPVTTDLDGTFRIPSQFQSDYKLCWQALGYVSGCGTTFTLAPSTFYLGAVSIKAQPQQGVIYGRVALNDGRACRYVSTFIGLNTSTTVTADLQQGGQRLVHANNSGEYVLAGLLDGLAFLRADCEGAEVVSVNFVQHSAPIQQDFTLPNATPTAFAYAAVAGNSVRSVSPGTTVQATVQAKAGGSYPLHYKWYLDPPVKGFVSTDSPTINWTVPGPGVASAYVWAGDGQGGNVVTKISLSTTPNHIPFSGRVVANDAPFLANADVDINGFTTRTNAQGYFNLDLPKEARRYVLTITAPGYQMFSKPLYSPVVAGNYLLFRSQDFLVDPTQPILVTETNSDGSTRTQLSIPANSLAAGEAGQGGLATSPVHIRILTYDLDNPQNSIPGDFGGIDSAGTPYRLSTYGAVDIDIQDAAGQHFNLAPGKTAAIKMQIHPSLLQGAPATIPVWHYLRGPEPSNRVPDRRGLWLTDGMATRVGSFYQTTVTHFSAVNMDQAFTDKTAACTRVVVDTGVVAVPFKLYMTPVTGVASIDINHQYQIIDSALNVVVRIPATLPGFQTVQVQFDIADMNGVVIRNTTQIVTIGGPSLGGSMWSPPPDPPYSDCTSEVDYNAKTIANNVGPSQGFLTYFTDPNYLDPTKADGLAAAYYALIDPGGTKTKPNDTNDFLNWKSANGFTAGSTHVVYENEYDLGFGRAMYMQAGTCTGCVAYYVTNYDNVEVAVDDVVNHNGGQKQTVAMEYSPVPGSVGAPFTKFYVFNADGSISLDADLDLNGAKVVPTLCIICHNGSITNIGNPNIPIQDGNLTNARFIPFDLESFRYHPTNPTYSRTSQEQKFLDMNTVIHEMQNESTPVKALIENWYGGEGTSVGNFTPPFTDTAVPSGWSTTLNNGIQTPLYNAVVKKSCRSCHSTRDSNVYNELSWQSFDGLLNYQSSNQGKVFEVTCVQNVHTMPNAQRTFARFWVSTNPYQPDTWANSDLFSSGFTISCK